MSKFSGRHPGAEEVRAALVETGEAVAALLRAAEPVDGKGFGMKGGATKFLGYLCAHEAYHWAQVDLALRQAGVPIDEKSMYGLWEWGS